MLILTRAFWTAPVKQHHIFFFKDLNVINRPSGRLKFNWHLDSNLVVNFFRSEKAEAIFEFDPI